MIGRRPGDAPASGHDPLVRAWEGVLEGLEHQVQRAEHLAVDPSRASAHAHAALSAWAPPELAGTMPDGLVGRAQELMDRQAAVRADLARSLERTRADLARLRRPAQGHRSQAPAYVDVSA